jgi:hypothetical protein
MSGEEAKDFKGIITMVAVKQAGKCLIRAVQNTRDDEAIGKESLNHLTSGSRGASAS